MNTNKNDRLPTGEDREQQDIPAEFIKWIDEEATRSENAIYDYDQFCAGAIAAYRHLSEKKPSSEQDSDKLGQYTITREELKVMQRKISAAREEAGAYWDVIKKMAQAMKHCWTISDKSGFPSAFEELDSFLKKYPHQP